MRRAWGEAPAGGAGVWAELEVRRVRAVRRALEREDEEALIALWADAAGWVVVPWRASGAAGGAEGGEDDGWVHMDEGGEGGEDREGLGGNEGCGGTWMPADVVSAGVVDARFDWIGSEN